MSAPAARCTSAVAAVLVQVLTTLPMHVGATATRMALLLMLDRYPPSSHWRFMPAAMGRVRYLSLQPPRTAKTAVRHVAAGCSTFMLHSSFCDMYRQGTSPPTTCMQWRWSGTLSSGVDVVKVNPRSNHLRHSCRKEHQPPPLPMMDGGGSGCLCSAFQHSGSQHSLCGNTSELA